MELPLAVQKQDWNSEEDLAEWFKENGVEYQVQADRYLITKLPEGWYWTTSADSVNEDIPELWSGECLLADFDPSDSSLCLF